jgi:integrase
MKLTDAVIKRLTCPSHAKDILVSDDEQRGLYLRVSAKGSKTYLAQYTIGGVKRRVALGGLTLALARSAAARIMGEVAAGLDPASERKAKAQAAKLKAQRDELTLGALIDRWEAGALASKKGSYRAEAVRALKKAFVKQLALPAGALDRKAVVNVLDVMPAMMGARTKAYGEALFAWAAKRGSIAANPFANIPVAPTVKRDRVLTDSELRAIWQAMAGPGSYNAIVRLLMLTGQRRAEVAEMERVELSADMASWTISSSRTKNSHEHVVPLSPQARAIIEAAPRYANALVFPAPRGSAIATFAHDKERLDEAIGFDDWVLHDLRRTVATNLQRLGVRLEVTEAVLNHVSGSRGGIVGVYQKHDWADEKRAALQAWADRLDAIVEGREPGDNVVQLPKRA